jgi:amino acid transporter
LLAFIGGAVAFAGPTAAVGTFTARFSTDAVSIVSVAALAFITFFGFSAIAASAGEIIEPRKTVPRAIAASMVTVTVLYALVIVAVVNSPVPAEVVARQGETAMGTVAAAFFGRFGLAAVGQALIVAFMTLFPAEGGLGGLHLGLEALTGFATLNLLLPLAVVNVALVYSRRKFPDIERGFRGPASLSSRHSG